MTHLCSPTWPMHAAIARLFLPEHFAPHGMDQIDLVH